MTIAIIWILSGNAINPDNVKQYTYILQQMKPVISEYIVKERYVGKGFSIYRV